MDSLPVTDHYNFLSLALVLTGAKKIGRLSLSKRSIGKLVPFLERHGIGFSVVPRSKTKDAFRFESRRSVSRYELTDDDMAGDCGTVGRLLGYPRCCVERYRRTRAWSDVHFFNAALANSRGKGPFCFVNNVARCGSTLLLHFPCAFDCPASLNLGAHYLRALESLDRPYAEGLARELRNAVFVAEDFAINFQQAEPSRQVEARGFFQRGVKAKSVVLLGDAAIRIDGRDHRGTLVRFTAGTGGSSVFRRPRAAVPGRPASRPGARAARR